MNQQTEDIFLIVSEQVSSKVLDDVVYTRSPVFVRGEAKHTRSATLQAHNKKSVSLDFSEPVVFQKNEEVTLHFSSSGEKYFARGQLYGRLAEEVVTFNLTSEIYRVQRRSNFRISVPENEDYNMELYHPDGEFLGLFRIKDISAGGCRIYFNEPFPERIRSSHTFSGRLKIRGLDPIQIGCEVRHVQNSKANPDPDDKEAGIQFAIDDPKTEHRLISLVFELQRKMVKTD